MFKYPETILYPIDTAVDYRLPENREYAMLAWAEAMYHNGDLNQQLRLMNFATESMESKLWLAFLWGCCYNLIGPWTILHHFPEPPQSESEKKRFAKWYNANFDKFRVDTDCRYRKSKMIDAVTSYTDWLDGRTQMETIFPILNIIDDSERYKTLWDTCESWKYQGRLSTWNYVEAVALVTNWQFNIDCPDFMLNELTDSESNRNGVCWVLGVENLQTKHGFVKETGVKLSKYKAELLNNDAEDLFGLIKEKLGHITEVSRLNVETIFGWFKKKFRDSRSRYLFWDADRTWEEIIYTEANFLEVDCSAIWAGRRHWAADHDLCEYFPKGAHRGSNKTKMKVFINTGRLPDLVAWQNQRPYYTKAESKPSESTAKSLFD